MYLNTVFKPNIATPNEMRSKFQTQQSLGNFYFCKALKAYLCLNVAYATMECMEGKEKERLQMRPGGGQLVLEHLKVGFLRWKFCLK